MPKDIREKVEFGFDEEGKLLIEKWHKDEQELRSISFYFYSKSYVFSFWFRIDRDAEAHLEYISSGVGRREDFRLGKSDDGVQLERKVLEKRRLENTCGENGV